MHRPPGVLVLLVASLLAACAGAPAGSSGPAPRPSAPAPAPSSTGAASGGAAGCGQPTPSLTEGPYYRSGSPERTSLLEPGMTGTRLTLTGRVLSAGCRPVAGALLDFWQADARGAYDNAGYRLRGHQLTDASGAYRLETVVPGLYPGRTEHIHVKVRQPGGRTLTTQLFFPGVAQNDRDGIFDRALLISVRNASDGLAGGFEFVVPAD
jgi:protocatechuate 3,4-dioxygenase beta subunit